MVFPRPLSSRIFCWHLRILLIVLRHLRKPCCSSLKSPYFSACLSMTLCRSFSRTRTRSSVNATGRYEAGSPADLPSFSRGLIIERMLILGSFSVSRTVLHHLQIIGAIVCSVLFNNSGLMPVGPDAVLLIFLIIFLTSFTVNLRSEIQLISLGKSSSDQA